jgi:spore germination protein YaaH
MPDKQIFFDPQRKRWKRLRRILDVSAVVITLVLAGFIFNVLRVQPLPELLLPTPKHNFKALPDRTLQLKGAKARPARRKTGRKPSEIPLNSGEGLRAAYYVPYDEASYASFKEHVHQIDMLYPEWLHVDSPNATLLSIHNDSHREYPIVDGSAVHDPDEDNRIKRVIQEAKEDTEIFPHLNNYNPGTQNWESSYGDVLKNPANRAALRRQILRFFDTYPVYRGLSLDFESLPDRRLAGLHELHQGTLRRHARAQPAALGQHCRCHFRRRTQADRRQLRRHHPHELRRAPGTSDPGPIASQEWFVGNLTRVLKIVPKEKIICAIGNYGYDWELSIPPAPKKGRPQKPVKPKVLYTDDFPVSEAWQRASDADADLDLDYDSLNPHFEYIDEDANQRHVVWFLDGVTVLNELRAARELGLQTFALWRLGSEDSSCGMCGTNPAAPIRCRPCLRFNPATTSTSRAKATSCASPACLSRGSAPSPSTPTNPTRTRSSSSMSTWTFIPARTRSSTTATTQ